MNCSVFVPGCVSTEVVVPRGSSSLCSPARRGGRPSSAGARRHGPAGGRPAGGTLGGGGAGGGGPGGPGGHGSAGGGAGASEGQAGGRRAAREEDGAAGRGAPAADPEGPAAQPAGHDRADAHERPHQQPRCSPAPVLQSTPHTMDTPDPHWGCHLGALSSTIRIKYELRKVPKALN